MFLAQPKWASTRLRSWVANAIFMLRLPALKRVDAHFGWAKNIAIYDISPQGHHFLGAIQFDGDLQEDGNEDKLAPKLEAIKDCAILYVAAIGGSGAARVVAKNIHPVKVNQPEEIGVILIKLEEVLKGSPPPWLRKAL